MFFFTNPHSYSLKHTLLTLTISFDYLDIKFWVNRINLGMAVWHVLNFTNIDYMCSIIHMTIILKVTYTNSVFIYI